VYARRVKTALVALCLASCSYIAIDQPPRHPDPDLEPACTTSKTLPTIDLVPGIAFDALGAVSLGVAGYGVAVSGGGARGSTFVGLALVGAIVSGVTGLAFTASAVHGFRATARCRELEHAFETHTPIP
jgi:hypothetical protein